MTQSSVKLRPQMWRVVAFSSAIVLFMLAMIGCAARGWHAPREWALAVIYLLGVISGISAAFLRARTLGSASALEEAGEDAFVDVMGVRPITLGLASIVGSATSLGGAVGVAMLIGDWHSLFLASLVGSLWMMTYPLHILGAHTLLAQHLRIGIDGVRIARRNIPFRAIRRVKAIMEERAIQVDCDDGRVLYHRCVTLEIAETIAARIEEKLVSSSVDVVTTRISREARTVEAWKRALLSRDYRSSEISSEDAERILRSGASSPDERVGAAMVLAGRASGDDERARIRIAASACLDRRLRVALERAADDTLDDDTLAELVRARST